MSGWGVERIRAVFLGYAVVVAGLTHWPALRIPDVGVSRPDMLIHAGTFGVWAFLAIRCGWFGPWLSARNIALAGLMSVAYAAVDESTQLIPALRRTSSWDDFAADLFGIAGGIAAACVAGALHTPESSTR